MSTINEINTAFRNHVPQKLRAARAWLYWSLDDAQEHVGMNRQYISQAEMGRRNLSQIEKYKLYNTYLARGVRITRKGVEVCPVETNS